MPISIRVAGLNEVRDLALSAPEKLANVAVEQMAGAALVHMKLRADQYYKTGVLRDSVGHVDQSYVSGGRKVPKFTVGHRVSASDPIPAGSVASYAPFVVFGTRPHRIEPKNKKALRWVDPRSGNFAFSKGHRHPGYAGDDYVTEAAVKALDRMREIVENIDLFK